MGISLQLTSGKPKEPKETRAWASHLKFQMASTREGERKRVKKEGEEKVSSQRETNKWIENHASTH